MPEDTMKATKLGKSQGPAILNAMTKALAPTNHILKRQTGLLVSIAKSSKVSAENAMEAKRAKKKNEKNETKQTSLLEKLTKKKDGKGGKGFFDGFFGNNWGKMLGLAGAGGLLYWLTSMTTKDTNDMVGSIVDYFKGNTMKSILTQWGKWLGAGLMLYLFGGDVLKVALGGLGLSLIHI